VVLGILVVLVAWCAPRAAACIGELELDACTGAVAGPAAGGPGTRRAAVVATAFKLLAGAGLLIWVCTGCGIDRGTAPLGLLLKLCL
jgi:hypothetical protein